MMGEVDNLSDEQLDAALEQAALGGPGELPEPVVETPEESAPEVEPELPFEAAPEAAEETTEEVEAEAVEAEPEVEPEKPVEDDYDQQVSDARLAESEARAKKWEQIAGRHGGEIGFLKKQMAQLTQRPSAPVAEEVIEGELEQPQPPPAARQTDKVASWSINQALQNGLAEFAQAHPDADKYGTQMEAYMKSINWDAAQVMLTDDPAYAQQESRRVLEEAYWHAEAEAQAERKKELATKRVDQTAELKKAKERAAPSATGASPPPKPKSKSPEEMSDKDLDAALQKEADAAGRWY